MFLNYIIVYSFTSHILKFYEDLVVNLLTTQPSLKKKSDLQCKIHLHISLSKYMYVHLFLCDNTAPPPLVDSIKYIQTFPFHSRTCMHIQISRTQLTDPMGLWFSLTKFCLETHWQTRQTDLWMSDKEWSRKLTWA